MLEISPRICFQTGLGKFCGLGKPPLCKFLTYNIAFEDLELQEHNRSSNFPPT
jgi:hypothetical protein